jgi:hypothetical protein
VIHEFILSRLPDTMNSYFYYYLKYEFIHSISELLNIRWRDCRIYQISNKMAHVQFYPQLVSSASRLPHRYEEDLAINFHYHVLNCFTCTYHSLELCSKGKQEARPILDTFYIGTGGHAYSRAERQRYRQMRVEIPLCYDTIYSFLLWDYRHTKPRSQMKRWWTK